ncbi:MAG: efflux RND transporter periplasmic adaptor subunit, partial [Chloroflexota bacterium]
MITAVHAHRGLTLCAAFALFGCNPVMDRPTAVREPTLLTARATRTEINGVLNFATEVRTKPPTIVTTRIPGTVMQVTASPGARVTAGDPLLELDRPALEVQVARANLALAGAEARLAGLRSSNRPDEAAEAEAQLRAAKARLSSVESAPTQDQQTELARAITVARQKVAELEHGRPELIAQLETAVAVTRDRLERLQSAQRATPVPGAGVAVPPQEVITQAQQALIDAQEQLRLARSPTSGAELSQARQELALAGERLLLSRSSTVPSDLEEARATLEAAERRFQRVNQPVTDAERKSAELAVEHAWSGLELARLQLRESSVTAPLTGLISDVFVNVGAPTAAGSPLVSILPPEFELLVQVPELLIGAITLGQSVSIGVDAYPNEVFTGLVRALTPIIDVRNRTSGMKVEVTDPQFKLKGGMFANVSIAAGRKQGTIVVPREAVIGRDSDAAVYAVLEGRARRQPVQLGLNDGRMVEILNGISEGAEVVLSPAGLRDGDPTGR